jgi:hypothetical protein
MNFELNDVDVDKDPALAEQYGSKVPVVFIDRRETFFGKVSEGHLKRAIKRARWRSPISRILSRMKLALTRG